MREAIYQKRLSHRQAVLAHKFKNFPTLSWQEIETLSKLENDIMSILENLNLNIVQFARAYSYVDKATVDSILQDLKYFSQTDNRGIYARFENFLSYEAIGFLAELAVENDENGVSLVEENAIAEAMRGAEIIGEMRGALSHQFQKDAEVYSAPIKKEQLVQRLSEGKSARDILFGLGHTFLQSSSLEETKFQDAMVLALIGVGLDPMRAREVAGGGEITEDIADMVVGMFDTAAVESDNDNYSEYPQASDADHGSYVTDGTLPEPNDGLQDIEE